MEKSEREGGAGQLRDGSNGTRMKWIGHMGLMGE
jgi:hypothetical protein